jgi:PKD repeat protein/KaiC/GvpD/RAD55 family RecA-like ATPase
MKLSSPAKSTHYSRPFSIGRAIEAGFLALALLTVFSLLSPQGFADNLQLPNLLVFPEAPAQQAGQRTMAITDANYTAAYTPSQWNLVGSTAYVSGSISDLAANDSSSVVFSSYNSGSANTTFNYSPNSPSSDVDSNGNIGTHGNFTALGYGPDGITDVLAEGGVSGSNEQWLPPTGYQDPSSAWDSETLAYDNNTETASSSNIDAGSWSAYLILNANAITCGKIRYYFSHSSGNVNELQIDIYNSTWTNVYDGNGPWGQWSNVSFASKSVTQMRMRFYNAHHSKSETAYICEAQFLQDAVPPNYQLDLEAQWTGVNYTMANKWLCIYGATMSTENLLVDVWNGSGWSNVIASLSSGWNNISVASYLVSATFTVRFKDATPSDPTPDSWQVDVCLLQVWTNVNQYTAEVEFTGSSDLQSWASLSWRADSSWNTGSVNVTIQVYNYTLGGYSPSGTGRVNYISSTTANTDEGKTQTETSNPTSFRDPASHWKIKIKGVKSITQFQMKVDWTQFQDTVIAQDIPPVAQFTESAKTVDTGVPVQFDASSSYDPDGTITSYDWSFGDGNTGVGIVANHAYAENGTYTVVLTVHDNDGLTNTSQDLIVVNDRAPVAQFVLSTGTVDTGVFVQFDASPSYDPDGTITSYHWDFGDGNDAVGKVTTHSFAEDGLYTITLTVTDNDGTTKSALDTVSVQNRAPVAQFTKSASTVDTGTFVQFNASTSYDPDGTLVNYYWDFGDGQTGMGMVASHAFGENGTYSVALTVTDNDGLTDSTHETVVVQGRTPVAQFTKSANAVDTGVFVQFDASSSYDPDGTIVGCFWDFGDGKNATGIVASHSYADNGTYTVILMATDNDGLSSVYQDAILVSNKAPVASFTVSSITVYPDEIVTFNATLSHDSDGFIVSQFWDFGDGTGATGIVVSHAYIQSGTYSVTLTVTDDDGAVGYTLGTENILNRGTTNQPPIAVFVLSSQEVYTGEAVAFDASGSYDPDGTIANYLWNFGDGFTTMDKITTHAYPDNGFYMVTLTVTDDDGTANATIAFVTALNRAPSSNFIVSSTTAYTGELVLFNASDSRDSDGMIISYFWDFDDGTNATSMIATHAYNYNGTYTVKLAVTDDDDATDFHVVTEDVLNHVGPDQAPTAVFVLSADTVYTGEAVVFDASGSYDPDGMIASYFWDFGDNFTTSGSIVSHAYDENGNFLAILTVIDNDGSMTSGNATEIILNRPPYASFTMSTPFAQIEENVYFNASMSHDEDGTITLYFWDFGDQTNATGVTVSHRYVQCGNYSVTLTVTDNDGSPNATSMNETIVSWSTLASFTILPTQPSPDDLIVFDASSSYELEGTIERYSWDFGDGNTTETSTSIITHSYTAPGDFNITLTVSDTQDHNNSTSRRISLQIHNVAITDVALSGTETQIGQTVTITVKAKNKGTAPESFAITVFQNETVLESQVVADLLPGAEQVLLFYWNTSNVQNSGNFSIQAKADNVTGETSLSDNLQYGGTVSMLQAQKDEISSTSGFDWKWALVFVPAALLLSGAFLWIRRNGSSRFRSFEYFNEITNGGIPDSFSVLITGGPGSGKSMLCQELVHSFLTQEKSCLYITYDCFPDEVRDNLRKFHDEISRYEDKKKLLFVDCFSATSKNKDREYYLGQSFSLSDLGIVLSEATRDLGPSPKVVLDSITPLLTHIEPLKVVEFLQDRGARIKGISGTFIFTIGKATIEPNLANRLEETVDCIIELDESTNKGKTVRRLRVKKMRGKRTSDKWIRFEVSSSKGIVFPT